MPKEKKSKPETTAPEAAVAPIAAAAEVEKLDVEKDVIEAVPEEEAAKQPAPASFDIAAWTPKTEIGMKVKSGEIKKLAPILDAGTAILEAQIIDVLLPNLETDMLFIGQSKGKFGGGQKRIFRQTQKKSPEGSIWSLIS